MKAYQLRISVRDADPVIERTVNVPELACFQDLHSIIQSVMGWSDVMDYDFLVDDTLIGPYEVDDGVLNDLETALSDFGGAPIEYRYDLENPWTVDVEWIGDIDDHPREFTPILVGWNGDGPVDEDTEDRSGRRGFDREAVDNSLESWGVQGVYREGDTILSHDFRMKILMYAALMCEDPLVYDSEDVEVYVVTDDTEAYDTLPTVSPEKVSSEPGRYSIIQNGALSVIRDVYAKVSARHPDLPPLPDTDNIEEVLDVGGRIL